MSISKFQFEDTYHEWVLNETTFSDFNLLVGASGAGKTRILDALRIVRSAGIGGVRHQSRMANGCSWYIVFTTPSKTYTWEAKTSLISRNPSLRIFDLLDEDSRGSEKPRFLYERIVDEDGSIIVQRDENEFLFGKTRLPKLKDTESAISLINKEDLIAPLYRALKLMIFSAADAGVAYTFSSDRIASTRSKYPDLDSLKEATDLDILTKGYLLQEDHKDIFRQITDDYRDIFLTVDDIKIGTLTEFEPNVPGEQLSLFTSQFEGLTVGIKEKGIHSWITGDRMSSGMLRTLLHLIELTMAPKGTVVVIDELENSLGVNCLPQLTERLLSHSRDMQFIISSHHPYIISNIPLSNWKVVTRAGNTVTVIDASQIPALSGLSSQDKFIRLMNTREYEEGIR